MTDRDEAVKAIAETLWDTGIPTNGDAWDMARALAAAGFTVTRDRYEPDDAVETFCTERCRGGPKGCTDYCDSTRTVYRRVEGGNDA